MGGSGSDSGPTYTAANYDPKMIAQFMQTKQSKQWTPDQINLLHNAYHVQQGPNGLGVISYKDANNHGAGSYDVDLGLVNTFEQWVASQQNQQTLWNQYSTLAQQEQGRDQTVLTGPQTNNYQSLLGAPQGVIPNNLKPVIR